MANKTYNSYRGRRRGGKSILLLLLVLLLACGFIYIQKYITYADDGSIRFDLPFLREEDPELPDEPITPDEEPGMNLVIDQEEEPEQSEPEPVVLDYWLKGLTTLPADVASLRAGLVEAGANGFVVTMRDNTGRVFYNSTAAISSAVTNPMDPAVLQTLCAEEDLTSVARLNALHDSYYAWANMEAAGICQSTGYIWYDNLSYHWLEPAKEKARNYVVSLAVECAQMGFDQILLDELCYPSKGKLQKINYAANTMTKPEALALLLSELRTALEPYGTKLALLVDERAFDSVTNSDYIQASGQDLAVLAPLVDVIYTATADPAVTAAALTAAVGEGEAPQLVPITDVAAPTGNWYVP